jgi:hypothetical protein
MAEEVEAEAMEEEGDGEAGAYGAQLLSGTLLPVQAGLLV